MGMTDSQFKGFVRFVLDDIREVLETLSDGKEKEKPHECCNTSKAHNKNITALL